MLATKSIIAASRLAPLPEVPIARKERFPVPAMPVVDEEPQSIEEWMASEQMLFGADARDVFFGAYGEGAPGLWSRARAWALLFGLVYWRASEGDPLMDVMSRTGLGRVLPG